MSFSVVFNLLGLLVLALSMNQLNTPEMALSGAKNGSSLINCGNKMAI
jgi:hypothetical protein